MTAKIIALNYTSDISGSSIALLRLLETLPLEDFFLITDPNSYLGNYGKTKNWNVLEIPIPRFKKTLSAAYWLNNKKKSKALTQKIAALMESFSPDYLLVNSSLNQGWSMPQSLHRKTKVIFWVHELVLNPKWFFKALCKKVEKRSDGILCVSTPVEKLFQQNTQLFPPCVPAAAAEIKNPFQEKNKLKLLWVGTVSPRKGLHRLPEILSGINSYFPETELELCASVSEDYHSYYQDCLSKLKSLNLPVKHQENVELMDPVYSSDKILIVTSDLEESFNLVALEAMNKAMMVYAPINGGTADFALHGKNSFDINNLNKGLADHLHGLSESIEQVHSIQAEAQNTAEKFSQNYVKEKFFEGIKSFNTTA